MDRSFFTSLERHPVKALELPNGSGSTARSLVNVELHYSIAGALAVVGYSAETSIGSPTRDAGVTVRLEKEKLV